MSPRMPRLGTPAEAGIDYGHNRLITNGTNEHKIAYPGNLCVISAG